MKIIEYLKELVTDWIRYQDTSVPRGVDQQRYIHLKYTNQDKLRRFTKEHEYNKMLIDKVALHYFLRLNDETKKKLLQPYMKQEKGGRNDEGTQKKCKNLLVHQ